VATPAWRSIRFPGTTSIPVRRCRRRIWCRSPPARPHRSRSAASSGAASWQRRSARLEECQRGIQEALLRHYGAAGLAEAILRPSGTDALLAAALLVAAERPDIPLTAIIPAAAETGTGVPLAAACRQFDGPAAGTLLAGCPATVLEIPLRSDDGVPLGEDAVNSAFAAAARSVRGRAVICLTHGSKTGLVAPTSVPAHADVIVDACQARIGPDAVAAYLRRGWPVVLTASKFFGGPAFAAALLLPRARVAAFRDWRMAPGGGTGTLGTVLRWTAALGAIEAFGRADGMADALLACGAAVSRGLGSIPSLEQVGGLRRGGQGWDGLPSIFTFGVRDPADRKRLLTMAGLQPLHRRLVRDGVLLGQPVSLGRFGGLRLAIGARNLLDGSWVCGLDRAFGALAEAAATPVRCPRT